MMLEAESVEDHVRVNSALSSSASDTDESRHQKGPLQGLHVPDQGRAKIYRTNQGSSSTFLPVSRQNEKFLFQQSRKFLFETGKLAG
jgi:hypothetical protein